MSSSVARRHTDDRVGAARLLPTPGPKMAVAGCWWLFGLYALFYAKAPYTPTVEEEQRYSELMSEAVFSEEHRAAQQNLIKAQQSLDRVHVWGWRWREPYSRLVPERKRDVEFAQQDFDKAVKERNMLESEAKAQVGIWSEYGVDEVRKTFWDAYQSGKDFAKRMSWWDVLLGVGGRRDEELYVTMLRWLGQIMMNFTIGLVTALISFTFSLVGLLWTYKVGLLSGIAFFTIAFTAASSMVALFIGGMYGAAVGGVYVVAQQARQARLEGGRGQNPRYVRHRHYE